MLIKLHRAHNLFFKDFSSILFLIMCMGGSAHMSTGAFRGQERVLGPMELEIQAVVRCVTWVLGTELIPSGKSSKPS